MASGGNFDVLRVGGAQRGSRSATTRQFTVIYTTVDDIANYLVFTSTLTFMINVIPRCCPAYQSVDETQSNNLDSSGPIDTHDIIIPQLAEHT